MRRKVLFLGDSITDADHYMDNSEECLGYGYVREIATGSLREEVSCLNRGVDGLTIHGVEKVFCRAKELAPDVVSIQVGINDIGVYQNTGKSLEQQGFVSAYETLLQEIRDANIKVILCVSPFIFSKPERYKNWISEVERVQEMIGELCERYGAIFVPTQERMMDAVETYGVDAMTVDGIHLTEVGARVLAECWEDAYEVAKCIDCCE